LARISPIERVDITAHCPHHLQKRLKILRRDALDHAALARQRDVDDPVVKGEPPRRSATMCGGAGHWCPGAILASARVASTCSDPRDSALCAVTKK
jgi:hypothetical protein